MTVWDVSPGYLSNGLLLAEYRLIRSISDYLAKDGSISAPQPEIQRWKNHSHALKLRMNMCLQEMRMRKTGENPPLAVISRDSVSWPPEYLVNPQKQFELLGRKIPVADPGRIPLPSSVQQLWSHHKYSVMARSPRRYKEIGPEISSRRSSGLPERLCTELSEWLRVPPRLPVMINALEHMWGHVSRWSDNFRWQGRSGNPVELLEKTTELAINRNETYLLNSTALVELAVWLDLSDSSA